MTIELASVTAVPKPWGRTDLRPWSDTGQDGSPIGELWFGRADPSAPEPALLLKLLFTEQPLSIQVHPDDDYARSIGLPHGKTEAWYVVAADPGAQVVLGLIRSVTRLELRAAIEDGKIPDLVLWRGVAPDEALLVPAGTIHAIGAGLVIAEIQQRSDATFRLFDYERDRQLHVDDAVGAAITAPSPAQRKPMPLSEARRLLEMTRYFVLEQIDLLPASNWELKVDGEAWVLVVLLLSVASGGPAFPQGTPQTLSLMKVDPQTLATGFRVSKVVGSTVVNESNEAVGTIDDLIVTPGDKVPFAVLAVGGFLGVGKKYVVVPYSALEVRNKQMVLPGATKESLKALPEFKYID